MSDQHETGIGVLDLEELYLSQAFGRRPARTVSAAPATVPSEPAELAEPAWLEQVFLSDAFGHPEAVTAPPRVVERSASAAAGRPALVLLSGSGEGGPARDGTYPHHRAIAAVSGVAAAALVVASLASGTGHGPGRAPASGTEQAQGVPPGHGVPGSGGGSQPNTVGEPVLPNPSSTTRTPAGSGGGGTGATLTLFSPPAASVVPQGTTGGVSTPPAAAAPVGGGSSPGTPPPPGDSGAGGVLTPALSVIGNEVSSVGSSVSSTTGDVDQALPVASVIEAVGTLATSATDDLGGGTPPTILAGGLQQ